MNQNDDDNNNNDNDNNQMIEQNESINEFLKPDYDANR